MSFTGGRLHIRPPPLDPEETRCLEEAEIKLHTAYAHLAEQLHW